MYGGVRTVKRIIILLLAVLLLGCSMGGTEKQSEATEQPAEQQPPEWSAEHPAEQEPKMPDEVQPEAPTEEPKETSAPAPGAAEQQPPEPEPEAGGSFWGPKLYLNGKELNVYTEHYFIEDEETFIPLHAFLLSVGAVYADSPYTKYQVQSYELCGIRFIVDEVTQVFALEREYDAAIQELKAKPGNPVTHANLQKVDLFSPVRNENTMINGKKAVYWGPGAVVDHRTLETALREAGLTIEISVDSEKNAIYVELTDPQTDSATIPEDPDRPALRLKTYAWQGYSCLIPETFEIQAIRDQKLSATEKALLKLDMDALQTVGLTDMDYYLVAESMLNGKDLLTWYLTADGWDDKPEDFDTAESVEIVPGIVSVHYYNRNYNSYICIAKLNTIGTNILFLSASSLTKDGTADFDSIVKRFVEMNGDSAPSDNDILNGKYGKSKVFAGDGYQITLTEQFSEQKSEKGFDGYYTSYFGAVMIKIEPFTLKAGLADKTLTEYIQDVIRNNSSDAQPEERDGLIYYRYQRDGRCGWNFAFKGDTAFYLVQFMCREADESELTDLFFAFAKSMTINQSSEKETSQTVFEAEALTEDHPAVASLAKASEENALICADLCAQLLVLHESEALPFGLDFILQEISRVAEKDDRVYYNMVIQSGADAYSVQWLSDAGEQHAILASIYAISSDGEHCIFYTGEHTALLYHVYSEWDEEAIRAECVDKVAAACRIDRWKAESVLKQLDLLCDSLSKDDDLFMYNPMESVICVQETEHTCLIRIVPIFSDQEDAFFMVHTEGIVPVIEQYEVKGTVPLTTADRQKRQENRPHDIEDKTDNTETIAGFSVTKESDEEMTKYLKNRQWKELPEDNDKQGLIEKFAVTGDKCAIGLKDRIYIYDHEECVAGYQFVVSGEFRLFSDQENFYIFDVRSKKFICIDETSGACSLYALTKEAIQKESDKLIWLGVFTAKNASLNKGEYDLKYEVKAKTISIGNYTLANRNPAIKPLLTASYDTLCYVNDSNESILYTSKARLTWITVFLVVILVSSIAGIMVIVHFSRRCRVTTETKGTKRCQD